MAGRAQTQAAISHGNLGVVYAATVYMTGRLDVVIFWKMR